ncbi:arrestin domain-containing protein 1 [Nematolebias whitei]|uniref:arrestin domain-containing protein 1 n=1 Tax=Nematolebias whitei TaxID=451745 RepID=UPI00189A3F98|nr:arrestin domain-containing protein 1 [Nematolebias whitei]
MSPSAVVRTQSCLETTLCIRENTSSPRDMSSASLLGRSMCASWCACCSRNIHSTDERVTYEMKKPIHDVKTIANVEGGVVKAGREVEWKEQIIVPPLPQSSLAGCELIKIEYYVKVSLKSPDVMLMLPIHVGNVSLDKKRCSVKKEVPPSTEKATAPVSSPDTSAPASSPTLPPRPAPKPAPRPAPRSRLSSYSSPSAPPAEFPPGAEGRNIMSDDLSNKRQSQLVSPHAFSYAPGLFFSPNQQPNGAVAATPSGPSVTGATGSTGLYPPLNRASPTPAPPGYGISSFPHEAPPSYDESCNT